MQKVNFIFDLLDYAKKPWDRELSKVFNFFKIALRTVLVFLVFHINIFENDIFVNFSFVFIYFGYK
jgi:hypothetical protein